MAITKISNDLIDLNQTGDFSGLRLPEGTTADREESFTTDYLVVGGGGGTSSDSPGGGGAGGLRTSYGSTSGGGGSAESDLTLIAGTSYTITVGSGGVYTTAGSSSTFSTITSDGGGRGAGTGTSYVAGNGASGGGGSGGLYSNPGGNGTANQGFAGGTSGASGLGTGYPGGGGGGASAVGATSSTGAGANGGAGLAVNILNATNAATAGVGEVDSSNVYYAGGGGGSTYTTTKGSGGLGGGGDGQQYTSAVVGDNGTANTGGGGGGKNASGGSGVVILRYPTAGAASFTVTGTLNTPSTTDTIADNNYPTTNLAYYKLDGNATDSSGNGNNATASNVLWGGGRFKEAAIFDGVSNGSQILIPDAAAFSPANNDLSFSVWINTTSTAGAYVLSKQNDSTGTYEIQLFMNSTGTLNLALYTSGGSGVASVTTTATVNDGNWHHVVFVIDTNTSVAVYVDTVGVTSSSWSGTMSDTVADVGLGYGGTGMAGNRLNGSLDQVRFFASTISVSQITELYNESYQTKFTEGSDTILAFNKGTGTVTFAGSSPTPPAGSIRYNTTTKTVEFYNGAWVEAASTPS